MINTKYDIRLLTFYSYHKNKRNILYNIDNVINTNENTQ